MIWSLITVILVSYLNILATAADEHHFVISPHPRECHGYTSSCLTLEQCLQLSISCISSHARILFLPGNHTVSSRTWVIANHVSNVSLIGVGKKAANVAAIWCRGMLSFIFIDAANLHIAHCPHSYGRPKPEI